MPTKIEWAEESWNPVAGCSKCSPGCLNCYAERMAKRLCMIENLHFDDVAGYAPPGAVFSRKYSSGIVDEDGWTGNIYCDDSILEKPLHWRNPRRIFVCSMSDLFHEKVPFEFVDKVIQVFERCPQHTGQLLTKRSQRMYEYSQHRGFKWPKNIIGMVTAENQNAANMRIPDLLQCAFATTGVSLEPLLGAVDLTRMDFSAWETTCIVNTLTGRIVEDSEPEMVGTKDESLDWVIVGGESGPGARPMHPDWVRSIRDQCQAVGVPFFFKQWGAWEIANKENAARNGYIVTESRQGFLTPYNDKKFVNLNIDGSRYKHHPQPNSVAMVRVGKKTAGNLLDGQKYEEYPK